MAINGEAVEGSKWTPTRRAHDIKRDASAPARLRLKKQIDETGWVGFYVPPPNPFRGPLGGGVGGGGVASGDVPTALKCPWHSCTAKLFFFFHSSKAFPPKKKRKKENQPRRIYSRTLPSRHRCANRAKFR